MRLSFTIFLSVFVASISMAQFSCNAGPDKTICPNVATALGGAPTITGGSAPYTITWEPATGLSSATTQNPNATGIQTVTYTLTVKDNRDSIAKDSVTITVYSLAMSAGDDITIDEGTSVTLHASPVDPALTYSWTATAASANSTINYGTSASPDVFPKDTTTYILTIKDTHGCTYVDHVIVYVTPSDNLIFYNSITPNSDGNNDVWEIGNIEKFPKCKLKIFNRYGQAVYSVTGYKNDWNGRYLGQELPAGTYFYVLDTNGENSKIYKGDITIYR